MYVLVVVKVDQRVVLVVFIEQKENIKVYVYGSRVVCSMIGYKNRFSLRLHIGLIFGDESIT